LSDSVAGGTLATFTTPGKYRATLVAVDGAQNTADVLAWTFTVTQRAETVLGTRPGWDARAEAARLGARPQYYVGETYETLGVAEDRLSLFVNVAADDVAGMSYVHARVRMRAREPLPSVLAGPTS